MQDSSADMILVSLKHVVQAWNCERTLNTSHQRTSYGAQIFQCREKTYNYDISI